MGGGGAKVREYYSLQIQIKFNKISFNARMPKNKLLHSPKYIYFFVAKRSTYTICKEKNIHLTYLAYKKS